MMVRKLVLPVALAFAAVVGFPAVSQAACEGVQCLIASGGECADPESCPVCFEDTYVLGVGPINLCML